MDIFLVAIVRRLLVRGFKGLFHLSGKGAGQAAIKGFEFSGNKRQEAVSSIYVSMGNAQQKDVVKRLYSFVVPVMVLASSWSTLLWQPSGSLICGSGTWNWEDHTSNLTGSTFP
jgi:hypothetical protein